MRRSRVVGSQSGTKRSAEVAIETVARFFGGVSGSWAIVGRMEQAGDVSRCKIRRCCVSDLSRFDLRIGDFFTFEEVAANATQGNQSTAIKIIEKITEDESLRSAFESSKSDKFFLGNEEIVVDISTRIGPQGYSMKYRIESAKGTKDIDCHVLLISSNFSEQQAPLHCGKYAVTGAVLTPALSEYFPAALSINSWPGTTIAPKEVTAVLIPNEGTVVFCCGVKPVAKSGEYFVAQNATGDSSKPGLGPGCFCNIWQQRRISTTRKWPTSSVGCHLPTTALHMRCSMTHLPKPLLSYCSVP